MANRAEDKFAASATDGASEVKADAEPKMAYRVEDKFAASTTDEAFEVKADVEPKMVYRAEEKFAASATDEAFEVKADVEPKMAYRAEEKFAASATDEAFEVKAAAEPKMAYRAEDKFVTDQAYEEKDDGVPDGEVAAVHIVHLIRPEGEEPEAFDIRTLASVIGSEEAAKEAVVYHYTVAASGFAARLTPKQVAQLSEKPEVLVVTPDKVCQLIR